jgi:hypothetical protein
VAQLRIKQPPENRTGGNIGRRIRASESLAAAWELRVRHCRTQVELELVTRDLKPDPGQNLKGTDANTIDKQIRIQKV